MPLPSTKAELLESLNQAYSKLDTEFDEVDSQKEQLQDIEGNVFCCDIVARHQGYIHE